MITGAQIRAARAMVRWSAERLAQESNVGVATIRRAESDDGMPNMLLNNLASIRAALEAAGVEFTNGEAPGVRIRAK